MTSIIEVYPGVGMGADASGNPTGTLYTNKFDGSGWTSAPAPPGSFTVANVKDAAYGAVGDGVVDDTIAIQSAINAVNTAGGGVVFFPPATYKITAALQTYSNQAWLGGGADNGLPIIKQISTTADGVAATNIAVFKMENLYFYGPSSGTGKGLNLSWATTNNTNIVIRDCRFNHFGSDGVHIDTPTVTNLERVVCLNNGGHGFYLGDATNASGGTSTTLNSCYANSNAQAGYYLQKLQYSSLNGCASDSNGAGYYLDTCIGISIQGCGTESNVAKNGYNGNGFVVSAGRSVGIRNCFVYQGPGGATPNYWVTNSAANVQIHGSSDGGTSPTNSVQYDSGSTGSVSDITCQGAVSLPAPITTAGNYGVRVLSNQWQPEDSNYKAWNFDPAVCTTTSTPITAGTVYLQKIVLRAPTTVTNVVLHVVTLGATLTAGESFAGLYRSDGTQIDVTADQSTVWASPGTTGLKTMALGASHTLPAGYYYVAFVSNGTTGPAFARGNGMNMLNSGLGSSTFRFATNGTGTALPASFTPSANAAGSVAYWVALS